MLVMLVMVAAPAGAQAKPAVGPELTSQRLDRVLVGLRRTLVFVNQRDSLDRERQKADAARSALFTKGDAELQSYNAAESKWSQCSSDVFRQRESTHQQAYAGVATRMQTDPSAISRMAAVNAKYRPLIMAASQRRDTVEIKRLTLQMQQEMTGVDLGAMLKADTAAAIAKCGAKPARPAWMAQAEALGKRSEQLATQIRELSSRGVEEGAKASGMSTTDFAALREKLFNFRHAREGNRQPSQYGITDREAALMRSRSAQIDALARAL
jgi:hypothetical protein